MTVLAVELDNIWKRFPGVVANAGASLQLKAGSVHAVLGENGAGKTTLMNVLAGVYQPDEGTVLLRSTPRSFASPADAIDAGITMVHQEFRLVPTFTVTENVILGAAPRRLDRNELRNQVADLAAEFELQTDPDSFVWELSMGERQRVEILKALWRDASVLILDEPTAVLTPAEADALRKVTQKMAADGRSVIFISHKLGEVKSFCDEATVLRNGSTVAASLDVGSLEPSTLAQLMVGEAPEVSTRRVRSEPCGDLVLEVGDLTVTDEHQRRVVDNVSLAVRAGEIVGIAGVAGNGQRPLADALAGLLTCEGSVRCAGVDLSSSSVSERNRAGLRYVPEDRLGVGLAPKLGVTDNAIMRSYRDIGSGPMIDRGLAEDFAADLVSRYSVKTASVDVAVAGLSGGNLQRLLVGREIEGQPKVIIAAQPTRGLDVAGVAAIQKVLLEQSQSGVGIILISEDLDELFALSDRLLVMHEGHFVDEFDPDHATRTEIGVAMTGKATAS